MHDFLAESGSAAIAPQRLASLTTSSLPALRSFLEQFMETKTQLKRAIAEDELPLEASLVRQRALYYAYR